MHVIIMGCGRQGARLAELLEAEDIKITIIDNKSSAFSRLNPKFKGDKVIGTGIDVDVLERAGIKDADVFVAVTNGDNRNLMSAQIAKDVFKVPKVLCRVYDPKRAQLYHDLGLQTVCSTTVGARMFRNLIIGPKVLRSYQLGTGTALAIEVKVGDEVSGKKIKELEIPREFRVCCVVRDEKPIIPEPDFVIKAGDQLFSAVNSGAMEKVKEKLKVTGHVTNIL